MQLDELDCKLYGRVARAFKRAAPRIGNAARHLDIRLDGFRAPDRPCKDSPFLNALLSRKVHLAHLMCLQLHVTRPGLGGQTLLEELISCLLSESPQLQALSLRGVTCLQLADRTSGFQHMRHLELHAETLPVAECSASNSPSFNPGEYFPSLQTLFIYSSVGTVSVMQKIDISGCPQLKKLRLRSINVQELIKRPECNLQIDLWEDGNAEHSIWLDEMASHLPACNEVFIDAQDGTILLSAAARGFLGPMAAMQRLLLAWPTKYTDQGDFDEESMREDAEHLLANLLPFNGQPLVSLRVLKISAVSIVCAIPRGLSNLEELSIVADGCMDLSFEDPAAIASSLNTFYAFGLPLITESSDMLAMCGSMARRGKILAAVSAPANMEYEHAGSTCIYMRPAMAMDATIQELFHVVKTRLSECNCRVCFICLERSNMLTPEVPRVRGE